MRFIRPESLVSQFESPLGDFLQVLRVFSRVFTEERIESVSELMAWFLLSYAFSAVRSFIERRVPFQIMSNQLYLPQVDSNQGEETSQR